MRTPSKGTDGNLPKGARIFSSTQATLKGSQAGTVCLVPLYL